MRLHPRGALHDATSAVPRTDLSWRDRRSERLALRGLLPALRGRVANAVAYGALARRGFGGPPPPPRAQPGSEAANSCWRLRRRPRRHWGLARLLQEKKGFTPAHQGALDSDARQWLERRHSRGRCGPHPLSKCPRSRPRGLSSKQVGIASRTCSLWGRTLHCLLLTGKPPYPGKRTGDEQACRGQVPPARQVKLGCLRRLEAVCQQGRWAAGLKER